MIKHIIILILVLSYTLCVGQHLLPISYNEFLPVENTGGCYQDQQGYFWFYSIGHGLECFNGVENQGYSPNNPKPYNIVFPNISIERQHTHEQIAGDIWRISIRYVKDRKDFPSHIFFFRNRKVLIDIIFDGADVFIPNMPYPTFKSYKNYNLYQICPTTAIQSKDTIHINDTLVIECIYHNNAPLTSFQGYTAVNTNLLLHEKRDKDQKLTAINWLDLQHKTTKPALEFQQWLGTVSHFRISDYNDSTWYIRKQQTDDCHYLYHYNHYNQNLIFLDTLFNCKNKRNTHYLLNNQYHEIAPTFETTNYSRINIYDTTKKATYWLDVQNKQGLDNYYPSPFSKKVLWRASSLGLSKYYTWLVGFQPNNCNSIPRNIFAIHEDHQHRVWLGSYGEGMHYWKEGSLTIEQGVDSIQKYKYLGGHQKLFNGQIWFSLEAEDGILVLDSLGKPKQILQDFATNYFIYQSPYDSTIALGSHINGLYLYKDSIGKSVENGEDWQLIPDNRLKTYNVLTAIQDLYGRWWGGRTSTGTFCYDSSKDKVYNWLLKEEKSLGLMSSAQDSNHNLWFGTNKGLFFYNLQHFKDAPPDIDNWKAIGTEYFGNTDITTLYNYKDSLLFIGDKKGGFGVLNLQDFYATPRTINLYFWDFKALYGIKMIEQNIFTLEKDRYLWLSNPTMLIRIDVPNIDFTQDSIELQLEEIVAYRDGELDSIAILNQNNLNLAPQYRELLFNGHYLSFMMDRYDGFHWVIKKDGKIISTAQTKIPEFKYIFQNSGSYVITLTLKQRHKIIKSVFVTIDIQRYWTECWELYAIIVLIMIALIVGWTTHIRREQLKRKDVELAYKTIELENSELFIQAIANSTNSHFISNALNFTQTLTKNPQVRLLIQQLGENIRTLFKLSSQNKIAHALQHEMQLVNNLISIQKMQFSDTFKTYIPPDADLLKKYRHLNLPVGALLTHVENAINHGIRHRPSGYEGQLTIKIIDDKQSDYLSFLIIDNGIGRQKAKKIRSHNTKQGLSKQEKIYKKYNKLNKLVIKFYFEDLTDNQEGTGTKVYVQIPKYYNYEFPKD